jgi:hypothetical protein
MHHMTTARAALSTDAIKVAAKSLATNTPRAAIRAAIRHDAPGHPMEMLDGDMALRTIPSGVTWLHGNADDLHMFARRIQMRLTLSAIHRGRAVIRRTTGRSDPAGEGFSLASGICKGSNNFQIRIEPELPDPDVETVLFIDRYWSLDPAKEEALVSIIDSYRSNPKWSVLVYDPVGPKGLHRSMARDEDTRLNLLKGPTSAFGEMLAQIGDGTMPFRLDRDRCHKHPLGRIKMMEKAIGLLDGQAVAPTHTGRLEQVSRAFGFRSWHAAEGRGKSS